MSVSGGEGMKGTARDDNGGRDKKGKGKAAEADVDKSQPLISSSDKDSDQEYCKEKVVLTFAELKQIEEEEHEYLRNHCNALIKSCGNNLTDLKMKETEDIYYDPKYVCRKCFPARTDMGIFSSDEVLGMEEYEIFHWMPNVKLGAEERDGEMVLKQVFCKQCDSHLGRYYVEYPDDDHPVYGIVIPKTYSIPFKKLLVWRDGSFYKDYLSTLPYEDLDASEDELDMGVAGEGAKGGTISAEEGPSGDALEVGKANAVEEGDSGKGLNAGETNAVEEGDASGKGLNGGETNAGLGKGIIH